MVWKIVKWIQHNPISNHIKCNKNQIELETGCHLFSSDLNILVRNVHNKL